jgi:chemotaxis protein CheX
MKQQFVQPFIDSMSKVLVTMARIKPSTDAPDFVNKDLPPADITGFIPLSSPQTQGSLVLSFPKKVILHIAENMFEEKFETIDNDIIDLVGELTNMVTGNAKALLDEKGFSFGMDTPTVIKGTGQTISHVGFSGTVVVVPFNTAAGEFYVEVCFKSKAVTH